MVDLHPPPQKTLAGRAKPGPEEVLKMVGEEFMKSNRRLNLVENRMDNIQDHLDLVDNNLIEKHKTAISDIRVLQSELRDTQSQMRELSELLKRAVAKTSDFASRDDVKTMERYLNYWSPMSFTTKNEVESMIGSALENIHEKTHSSMSKEEVSTIISEEVGKIKVPSPSKGLSEAEVKKLLKNHTPKSTSEFSGGLTNKEVEEMIVKSLEKLPKGGLDHDEVKKITRKHIEDLFGKL